MTKTVENIFAEGMQKDVSDELLSSKAYRDATNYRLVTTAGSTSGSLENILGMKSLIPVLSEGDILSDGVSYYVVSGLVNYNGVEYTKGSTFVATVSANTFSGLGKVINLTEIISSSYHICGAKEIRDDVVLFVTQNVTSNPISEGGESRIYKITIDLTLEEQTSIELLYSDNPSMNNSGGSLNFSTYYPIQAVSRYEGDDIQKVYWVDGYNKVRHANVASNLTTTGEAYDGVSVFYFSVDKFEFQQKFKFLKPSLYKVINGSLRPGVVQYAYQFYKVNGSETTISPLSDMIHITDSNDGMTSSLNYFGASSSEDYAYKGFIIKIDNSFGLSEQIGLNRIRLYRVYYNEYGQVPTISIVSENYINPEGESTIYLTDSGDSISTVSLDEFNIASTESFVAHGIDSKDDRLFVSNIEVSNFDIGDFDTRAVRFRRYCPLLDGNTDGNILYGLGVVSITLVDTDTLNVNISNLDTYAGVTVVNLTDVLQTGDSFDTFVQGTYNSGTPFSANNSSCSITDISWSDSTNVLTFNINNTSGDFVPFGGTLDPYSTCVYDLRISYTYYSTTPTIDAKVYDSSDGLTTPVTITVPTSDTPAEWNNAGWSNYVITHDGVNKFNDPSNDYDNSVAFKYQSDASTLGAEGPNIKIDFTTSNVVLDVNNNALTYETNIDVNTGSYNGYCSPYMTGKRSFQRDEVYRLYAVFFNDKGVSSFPSWICDLKFPSIKDSGYGLISYSSPVVSGVLLYPRVYFKSFPSDAVSAQVFLVPRSEEDKSVVTQGALASTATSGATKVADTLDNALQSNNICRFFSPEISISRNISSKNYDYLDYLGRFSTVLSTFRTVKGTAVSRTFKYRDFTSTTKSSNNKTLIQEAKILTPSTDTIPVGDYQYLNYDVSEHSYGGTCLVIDYVNSSWTPRGSVTYGIANYRRNLFGGQYGGYTFESRSRNLCRPCSDIITSTGSYNTCYGGDVFITYFQVLTQMSDLSRNCGDGDSNQEILFVPVESTINCDLRYDKCIKNQLDINRSYLMQEVSGEWVDAAPNTYNQPTDLYLYKFVYSQESTVDLKTVKPFDLNLDNVFDCRVKASNRKLNGEYTDSWTKFGINEYIDVDSKLGPINSIKTVNDRMFFWQDRGFGYLSINERAIVTDDSSSQIVLGTGGLLDKYFYISDIVGCKDRFSIVRGSNGVYWYDKTTNELYSFSEGLVSISKTRGLQSYLFSIFDINNIVIAIHDIENNEILFTFYLKNETKGYTISYNEIMGCFVSRYTFIPNIYVPYKNKILSTTSLLYNTEGVDSNILFLHNSNINNRCYFYGLGPDENSCYHNSTIKLLFNPYYSYTKVFDNIYYISNLYDSNNVEVFDKSFGLLRCYNDYQNSDYITLSPGVNLMRRERSWTTIVPRNVISVDVNLYPDIFDVNNFNINRKFKERLRDKYMTVDLVFINNGDNTKFVFHKIGCNYRISIR